LYLSNVFFHHLYKLSIIIFYYFTLLRTHHILYILHECTKVFISIDRIAPVELMLFNSLGFSISRSINYSALKSLAFVFAGPRPLPVRRWLIAFDRPQQPIRYPLAARSTDWPPFSWLRSDGKTISYPIHDR